LQRSATNRKRIGKQKQSDLGHLLENVVYLELLRRGGTVYLGKIDDKEIDFVCRQSTRIIELIQVSYDISNPKTIKREVSALLEASAELNCQSLSLLTWDDEKIIKEDDKEINVMPVWKWLLKNND
jgi:predicted AAA+ superfamily ATPase